MSNPSLFEKLQLKDEKNLLIQGLPSSIEKQFAKLSYAKNVTPLLKSRKVDFALIFAINQNQLNNVLKDVFPALHPNSTLWIAYPKQASKIVSDLNRDNCWSCITSNAYETLESVTLDHVWSAIMFKKCAGAEMTVAEEIVVVEKVATTAKPTKQEGKKVDTKKAEFEKTLVVPPVELEKIFTKQKKAREIFSSLSETNQKEYVTWIEGAKRQDTRERRTEAVVEKLMAGKKTPTEK